MDKVRRGVAEFKKRLIEHVCMSLSLIVSEFSSSVKSWLLTGCRFALPGRHGTVDLTLSMSLAYGYSKQRHDRFTGQNVWLLYRQVHITCATFGDSDLSKPFHSVRFLLQAEVINRDMLSQPAPFNDK